MAGKAKGPVRINTGMRLLQSSLTKIDAAGERLGRSRAAIVDILVYLHADQLSPETMVPASAIPPDSRARRTAPKRKK
jgi:hypothetical protein